MSELKIDLESLKSEENKSLKSMLEFFKANLTKKLEEDKNNNTDQKKDIEDIEKEIEDLEEEIDDLEHDKKRLEEKLEELQEDMSDLFNAKSNLAYVNSILSNKLTNQDITGYISKFSKKETETKTILSYNDFMLIGKIQLLFNLLGDCINGYYIEKTKDNLCNIYIGSGCLIFRIKDVRFEGNILDPVLLDFDQYMCYKHLEKGKNVTICRIKNDTRNQITIDDNEDTLTTVYVQVDNVHTLKQIKNFNFTNTNNLINEFFNEYENSKIDYVSCVACLRDESDN